MYAIEMQGITKTFHGSYANKEVSLKVEQGEIHSLLGENGAGKTTLMKIILGLLKPTAGKIQFFHQGKEVNEITMGYLPQYNTIDKKFPISVYEVVLSGLNKQKSLFRSFSKVQHDKVRETIARMGLEGLEQRAIGQLSGGQLQRALLGRALVSNPEVVILDEPNTYIDKRFEARLYALLEEINKECAIVLVSHDIGTILQNVKSIACVNGTLDYHPDTEVSAEWLEAHFECPIELLGHGNLPHRILKCHHHEE